MRNPVGKFSMLGHFRITYFSLIISIFLIVPISAQQFAVEKAFTWSDRANQLGSPTGHFYISQYRKVEAYSSDLSRIFSMRIKGNERVFSSPQGNYWATAEFIDQSATELRVKDFSMYTAEGKKLYSISDPGVLRFVLNDTAPHVVGVEGTEGLPETSLLFFDENGSVAGKQKITNYLLGKFCGNGSLFFALSADSGLYAFDMHGNPVYRLSSGRYFDVSSDCNLILASNGGALNLYYQTILTNTARANVSKIKNIILADDKTSALVMTETSVTAYRIPDLSVLWVYQLPGSNERLSSCSYHPEQNRIALGISIDSGPDYSFSDRFNTGRIEVLDTTGQRISWGDVSYNSWSKGFPKVELSDDGKILWGISHHDLYKIPLK
jgi:hypothetical protein